MRIKYLFDKSDDVFIPSHTTKALYNIYRVNYAGYIIAIPPLFKELFHFKRLYDEKTGELFGKINDKFVDSRILHTQYTGVNLTKCGEYNDHRIMPEYMKYVEKINYILTICRVPICSNIVLLLDDIKGKLNTINNGDNEVKIMENIRKNDELFYAIVNYVYFCCHLPDPAKNLDKLKELVNTSGDIDFNERITKENTHLHISKFLNGEMPYFGWPYKKLKAYSSNI
jgi:hypothetical protein